ncbi:MAG: hypothetical protein ACMXX7_02150 [Candidatus Woesearchaeota archaeon]
MNLDIKSLSQSLNKIPSLEYIYNIKNTGLNLLKRAKSVSINADANREILILDSFKELRSFSVDCIDKLKYSKESLRKLDVFFEETLEFKQIIKNTTPTNFESLYNLIFDFESYYSKAISLFSEENARKVVKNKNYFYNIISSLKQYKKSLNLKQKCKSLYNLLYELDLNLKKYRESHAFSMVMNSFIGFGLVILFISPELGAAFTGGGFFGKIMSYIDRDFDKTKLDNTLIGVFSSLKKYDLINNLSLN